MCIQLACTHAVFTTVLQDLEGFDEEAERRQQAITEAGSRGRSPFKQGGGRNQAELGPGPLASGLNGSGGSGGSNTGDALTWLDILPRPPVVEALGQTYWPKSVHSGRLRLANTRGLQHANTSEMMQHAELDAIAGQAS